MRKKQLDENGNYNWVAAITRRHIPKLAGAVLLGLSAAAAGLAQPALIGRLIGAVGTNTALVWPIVFVVVLFFADAGLTSLQSYVMGRTGERIVYDTRTALIERVLFSDVKAFSRLRQGDVFARIVTDTSMLKVGLSQSVAIIVVDAAMVLGGAVVMLLIDPLLLGVTVFCLAVASLVSLALARKLRRAAQQTRTIMGDLGADLQRALGAMTTVKACRAEELESKRIGGRALAARWSGIKVSALNSMLAPTMGIGLQASLAAVIITGMARVASGSMDTAGLTAFIMYLFYLVSPLVTLFMAIGQLQQGRAAISRINELAAVKQEAPMALSQAADAAVVYQSGAIVAARETAPSNRFSVEFQHVHFAYEEHETTLRDVSFTVPARGLTAIVGPSGAGKTTLLQLLMRFYPLQRGRIFLHDASINAIPVNELRGQIGYVQQESSTLHGTIGENLIYGQKQVTDDDVERALWLSGLTHLVCKLPKGLETELGDSGLGLSGGQRQRLAIARMLIRGPAVLLLDEATSNLDAESELMFRTMVRNIAKECTVISVAHRMSTVVDADKIVVLEEGSVRDIGTHNELLSSSDLYQRLTSIQFQDSECDSPPAFVDMLGGFNPSSVRSPGTRLQDSNATAGVPIEREHR